MSDFVQRLQRITDYWMPRDELARVEVPVRWIKEVLDEIERLLAENAAKQAQIDALMLEYCPDEMTPEQIKTWGEHQRVTRGDKP